MSEPYALPAAEYGMTLQRFNVADMPRDLPQRDALIAANNFNHVRYKMLTVRQRLFVDAYLSSNLDATIAATKAGYPIEETLKVGKRLLKNKNVWQAIQYAFEYNAAKQQLKTGEIIDEIKKIAFSSPKPFIKKDALGRPEIMLPEDENHPVYDAVSEITISSSFTKDGDENRSTKVKMLPKLDALKTLLQYADPRAMSKGPTVNVNNSATATATASVAVINLLPVPSGQFLPAPPPPKALVIEHSPLLEIRQVPDQGAQQHDAAALASVQRVGV